MIFGDALNQAIDRNNSLACIGLDSDAAKLPAHLRDKPQAQLEFNKAILDATADLVCCYKINSAFYEATGAEGLEQLRLTSEYLHKNFPAVPLILAKITWRAE